jgi:hypothetical protein
MEEEWRNLSFNNASNYGQFSHAKIIEKQINNFFLLYGSSLIEIKEDLSNSSKNDLLGKNYHFSSIIETEDGYIACGGNFPFNGSVTATILKFNNAFDLAWEKEYLQNNYYRINQIKPVKGGFLIAGTLKEPNLIYSDSHQPFIAKIDHSGNILWEYPFQNRTLASFEDFLFYPDGRVVLIGTVQQYSSDNYIIEFQTEERERSFGLEGIEFQVEISPNPARNFLNLKFSTGLSSTGNVEYIIYDAMGRLIQRNNFPFEYFTATYPIDINQLLAGVYFLKVQYGENSEILSWIKQ